MYERQGSAGNHLKRLFSWIRRPEHWRPLRRVQAIFITHPHEAGETYLVHLWFTAKMGLRFAYVSFVILMHGIFPFLFTRTGSTQVEKLYRTMKSRIPKKRLEEMDRERLNARMPHEGIAGEARVAIVGGGFSGVAVVANLVRQARRPLTIDWFDKGASLAQGVAYSTKDAAHLLNVRAVRMGALAGQPDGFYQWLTSPQGADQVKKWYRGKVEPASYVPRALYACYLHHLVEESLRIARNKGIQVNITRATVSDAVLFNAEAQQLLLTVEHPGIGRREVLVDAMVLATGNLPPRKFGFQSGIIDKRNDYVADIWSAVQDPAFAARIAALPVESEILIIGTGLTAVDTVLTLRASGFRGKMIALSRTGVWPTVHQSHDEYPAWSWVQEPRLAPATAFGLLRGLRKEVREAAQAGHDWRAVIDAIRPVTQVLWRQLSTQEKRKFLDRLSTFWNIHRHRMAPDVAEVIHSLMQQGTLRSVAGSMYYVGSDKAGLTVSYRKRRTHQIETISPALVINCTGPESDIAHSDHTLLKALRDRELITVGPLRVGVEVDGNGGASGMAPDAVFPVGPLLAGEFLECTAVPELREVAGTTAAQVLRRVDLISQADITYELSLGEWI